MTLAERLDHATNRAHFHTANAGGELYFFMRDIEQRITNAQAFNAQTAAAIYDAAVTCTDERDVDELKALAHRLTRCVARDNWWTETDAIDQRTGELVDAFGQFWRCGSRLCSSCTSYYSRRNRKRTREAIANQRLAKGERYYFVTFTITNPKLTIRETRELVNRAWTLLRKRQTWRDLIRGGVKSEEFTVTPNGFHYHLHMLLRSKWMLFQELRRQWTDCVAQAFEEQGLTLDVHTKDGFLIVKVKTVGNTEGAVKEVAKYITKSDSWAKLDKRVMAEIGLTPRWNRMFELFGTFREANASPIVHTGNLSDGEAVAIRSPWREQARRIGFERYSHILAEQIANARDYRERQIRLRYLEFASG